MVENASLRNAGFAGLGAGRLFLCIAVGVTLLRVLSLVVSDANLGPDEAQYWVWSKTPAFGYFSKPPLIAWSIAASTAVFGDAEWAVRLPAPLFHLGAGLFIFALARRIFDEQVALWSGLGWMTMPGVALSSALMTTDAPLLFFWSAGLYFFFLTASPPARGNLAAAALLGASIGLGMLAKYAMIYFVAGAVLAAVFAPEIRRRIQLRDALVAALVAAALFAPNLLWNAEHHFQTIAHTAANADWGANMFRPAAFLEFVASQFGVFGPAFLFFFVWGAVTLPRRLEESRPARPEILALLMFAAPPLVIVAAQAFLSRAHANWAATAYPSALILIVAWTFRAGLGAALKASTAFHAAVAAIFAIGFSNFMIADHLGLSNSVKRLRGWENTGADIRAAASRFDAILVDDREAMASLLYYARGGPPIRAWNSNHRIDHHFEAFMAFDPADAKRTLYVSRDQNVEALHGRYGKVEPAGIVTTEISPNRKRVFYLYAVDGLKAAD